MASAPYNERFAQVFGSSLTPQQVTKVLQNADVGFMWGLADLCGEMRGRDGHLHSELQKRELRVAGATWAMMPPEGSGDMGESIARWVTERLQEIESRNDLGRSFVEAIADLQGAVYMGRAGLEVVWRDEGGWYVPRELYFLHARRFAYATDWRIHLWDASGTAPTCDFPLNAPDSPFGVYPGLALDRFPRGKFIVHTPRILGGYPTTEGLGRLLIWWSCFKRFTVRDFLAFAEWAGRGLRTGQFSTGRGPMGDFVASPEDKNILEDALAAMSSSNVAIFADTTDPKILSAPSDNDVHDRLVALCNAEQSKAILGGSVGADANKVGGNRSVGEVLERGELMIARYDATSVAGTFLRDLIRPMVQINFGVNAPVPTMQIHVDPEADLDATSKRIHDFVEGGGEIAQDDARNLLNFPKPADGAKLMAPVKRSAA